MIIYIIAFPIYSFVLPVYSFWNQDNFTWGNTRIVIGEKGSKQVIALDDEGFDPRSIPLQRWDDYALSNNLPGRRGVPVEKTYDGYDENYEMDDMRSVYSAVKPASTILTGYPNRGSYMPPQSPAPFGGPRQSLYSYADNPAAVRQRSFISLGGGLQDRSASPYQDYSQTISHHPSLAMMPSSEANLVSPMGSPSPGLRQSRSNIGFTGGSRTPIGAEAAMRPVSTFDFQNGKSGPDDMQIVEAIQGCLREVDLDNVTKKQVRALVEQRLQTELVGERRTFMDRMIDSELANM